MEMCAAMEDFAGKDEAKMKAKGLGAPCLAVSETWELRA